MHWKLSWMRLTLSTPEKWTFIKSNPYHYSLTTLVSSSTSTTTADCIINLTNTMVPNKVTSLSNEQICIRNRVFQKMKKCWNTASQVFNGLIWVFWETRKKFWNFPSQTQLWQIILNIQRKFWKIQRKN